MKNFYQKQVLSWWNVSVEIWEAKFEHQYLNRRIEPWQKLRGKLENLLQKLWGWAQGWLCRFCQPCPRQQVIQHTGYAFKNYLPCHLIWCLVSSLNYSSSRHPFWVSSRIWIRLQTFSTHVSSWAQDWTPICQYLVQVSPLSFILHTPVAMHV